MHGKLDGLLRSSGGFGSKRERGRYSAVAAVLCAAASLFLLLTALLLREASVTTVLVLAGLGLCLAGLYLSLPWERMARHWIVAAPASAIVLVAAAAVAIDPSYGFYLVFIAGFTAYTYEDRRVVVAHLTLIALALAAPIALVGDSTREALAAALIYGPGVILLAGLAAYVRDRTDARERAHRQFADDALALAMRIRTQLGNERAWFEPPEPPPARLAGIASVVRPRQRGAHPSPPRRAPARSRVLLVAVAVAVPVSIAGVRAGTAGSAPQQGAAAGPPLGLTDGTTSPVQRPTDGSPRETGAPRPDHRSRRDRPAGGGEAGSGGGREPHTERGEATPVAATPATQGSESGSIAGPTPPAEAPEAESRPSHQTSEASGEAPGPPSVTDHDSNPLPASPQEAPPLDGVDGMLDSLGLNSG